MRRQSTLPAHLREMRDRLRAAQPRPVSPRYMVVRYYGGKWKLAPWILSHFPEHTCYVEPFCGAASVFFQKAPSPLEVINDLNGDVVNFFEVLREQPDRLIRALHLTPYARAEHQRAHGRQPVAKLERARRFYIRAWQSYATSERESPSGWRHQTKIGTRRPMTVDWARLEHLYAAAERLKQAMLENADAIDVVQRFDSPETLFYIDPPYTHTERRSTDDYGVFEMSDQQHRALAETVRNLAGMVVISGYDNPIYNQVLSGWLKYGRTHQINNKHRAVTEWLWVSPRTIAELNKRQLGFDDWLKETAS